MVSTCHMCGNPVSELGDATEETGDGFECADCGKVTCNGCKSIAVGRDSNHCRICRG